MKAKSDPKQYLTDEIGNVERRYLDLSAMLVQTTAVQVSLRLKGEGKAGCTQKNKTGFHMARTLKKEKK